MAGMLGVGPFCTTSFICAMCPHGVRTSKARLFSPTTLFFSPPPLSTLDVRHARLIQILSARCERQVCSPYLSLPPHASLSFRCPASRPVRTTDRAASLRRLSSVQSCPYAPQKKQLDKDGIVALRLQAIVCQRARNLLKVEGRDNGTPHFTHASA